MAASALSALAVGMIELLAPRKVIGFSLWFMRNWYFTSPPRNWYRANSPLTIRIVGIVTLILGLLLFIMMFERL